MMRVKFIIDDGNNAMIEVNKSLMVFKLELVMFSD